MRLDIYGPSLDELWRQSGGQHFTPSGGEPRVQITADSDEIPAALDRLATVSRALEPAVNQARDRYLALLGAAPPPEPRPGLGDKDLRALVRDRDHGDALVIDELGIQAGHVRADVATLTPQCWTGIEIKGERDSLTRLPRQVAAYSDVFDRCEVITVPAHATGVLERVPSWWDVRVVELDLSVAHVQHGSTNPDPQSYARAQMMWRDEAVEVLAGSGQPKGLAKMRRDQVWELVAQSHTPNQMRERAHQALASRVGWLSEDGAGRGKAHGRPEPPPLLSQGPPTPWSVAAPPALT